MNRRPDIRIRISPALVVACAALAISLGGTGYAALKLPAGSVGTAQLKKNAVTSPKVKNQSLLAEDFKPGQLPAGVAGAKGDKGEPGDPGPMGPRGPAGLSALQFVYVYSAMDSTGSKVVTASCPSGKKVLGGGDQIGGSTPSGMLVEGFPLPDLTGWRVNAKWPSGVFPQNWQLSASAVCATIAS